MAVDTLILKSLDFFACRDIFFCFLQLRYTIKWISVPSETIDLEQMGPLTSPRELNKLGACGKETAAPARLRNPCTASHFKAPKRPKLFIKISVNYRILTEVLIRNPLWTPHPGLEKAYRECHRYGGTVSELRELRKLLSEQTLDCNPLLLLRIGWEEGLVPWGLGKVYCAMSHFLLWKPIHKVPCQSKLASLNYFKCMLFAQFPTSITVLVKDSQRPLASFLKSNKMKELFGL